MATLDLTVARPYDVAGIRRRTIGQYTGPASYVAGGDSLTAGEVQIGVLERVIFEIATDGTNFRLLMYDHANEKVVWLDEALAEIAGATDLSGYSARFEAIGQ